ncbi:MAG: nucleoside monophosphate kinase [Candidatus Diapherotrites archaeon]
MALVFLGAPGAGKGTIIGFVSQKIPLEQVSTGDLIRAKVKEDPVFRVQVEKLMLEGKLVGDDVVEGLLREAIAKIPESKGLALDGYPRTLVQAESLEKILPEFNRSLKKVIYLNVSEKTVLQRLGGRRQCKNCNAIYNVVGMKPKKEGVCDKCGGPLFIRDDDKPEVIRKRLKEYQEKTASLIEHYKKKKLLFEVNANREAKDSAKAILKELGAD